jgi:hypothetical protein
VGIEAPTILPTIYASKESRHKNAAHLTHEDKNFGWAMLKKNHVYINPEIREKQYQNENSVKKYFLKTEGQCYA